MDGKRLVFLVFLVALFVGGVFALKTLFKNGEPAGGSQNGNSGTIRGVVQTLLPSGKVIVVKKEDGSETLLSLSDASTITNELGEDLFYTDVKVGMPISAAGIKGVTDNVVTPSLVTVQLNYADKGFMLVRAESLQPAYYALRYSEASWKASTTPEAVLMYLPVPGCMMYPSGAAPSSPGAWVKSVTERRIGGNVFQDARYTLKGEHQLRVITLEDPGEKYGVRDEGVLGPQDFVVKYPADISGPALAACSRAVDEVLSSFLLRQASQNILLIEPRLPLRVSAGEEFTIRGSARTFDGNVYLAIVNEAGAKLLTRALPAKAAEGARFGRFQTELKLPRTVESRLQLRIFQYAPASGAVIDLVQLPLTAE